MRVRGRQECVVKCEMRCFYLLPLSHLFSSLSLPRIGMTKPDDWYTVTYADFTRYGARALWYKYHGLINFLRDIYPNLPWNFGALPTGHFEDKKNVRKQLERIAIASGVNLLKNPQNLAKMNVGIIKKVPGGAALLAPYQDNLFELARDLFPDYKWCVNYAGDRGKREEKEGG